MSADFMVPSGSLLTQAIFHVAVAIRSPFLVISPEYVMVLFVSSLIRTSMSKR